MRDSDADRVDEVLKRERVEDTVDQKEYKNSCCC